MFSCLRIAVGARDDYARDRERGETCEYLRPVGFDTSVGISCGADEPYLNVTGKRQPSIFHKCLKFDSDGLVDLIRNFLY